MEIAQMVPSGPSNPGPMKGKLSAAEGKKLFHTLLHQQQTQALERKSAEEGDPVALAAWLPAGWPAMASGETPEATQEGMAPSLMSSLPAANPGSEKMGAGLVRQSAEGVSSEALLGGPDVTAGEEKGGPMVSPDPASRESGRAGMNISGFVLQGAPQAVSEITTDPAAQTEAGSVPGSPLLSETGGGKEGKSDALSKGSGILEQRFAGILHPQGRVSFDNAPRTVLQDMPPLGRPGESALSGTSNLPGELSHGADPDHADQPAPLREGALTAGPEVKPGTADLWSQGGMQHNGTIDQGDFPPNRQTLHEDIQAAEIPDSATPGVAFADRAPVSLPPAAEAAHLNPTVDRPVSESHILDQVIGRIAVDRHSEASRMSIKLQPEELGRIEIDLTVEQGRIKAQMVAQNHQVQDVLERHLPRLREALEQQGFRLDQIQVSVDTHAGSDGRGFSHQHRQADSHARSWSGPRQPVASVEKQEAPPPTVVPLGKVSLRI